MRIGRLRLHLPLMAYLAVFFVTVLALGILTSNAYRSSIEAAQREVIAGEFPLIRQTAAAIEHLFSGMARNQYHLSLHSSFTLGNKPELQEDMHRSWWVMRSEGAVALLYLDQNGRLVASAGHWPWNGCSLQEDFLNALSVRMPGEAIVSRVLPVGEGSQRCILVGTPLYSLADGEVRSDSRRLGSLVTVLDWSWLAGKFLAPLRKHPHVGVFAFQGDGALLYPSGGETDPHIPPEFAARGIPSPLVSRILLGDEGKFSFEHTAHGPVDSMTGIYTPMSYDGIQWTIGITLPKRLVVGPAQPVYRLVLAMASVIAIFLVVGVLLVGIVWRRSLIKEERIAALETERLLLHEVESARDELQVTVSQLRSTAIDLESSKREIEDANRELRRLDEMKSDFLSTVSHELRTPLAVMIGYLSILSDGELEDLPDEKAKALQISLARARQLERLINDLLSLSRIERGVMGLDLSLCDPSAIISDLLGDYTAVLAEKRIDVRFRPSAKTLRMEADEVKLAQVLSNLIDNAVKFSPEVSTIDISVTEEPDGVSITVADRGVGVPESQVDRIFDRFYQVDNTSKRKFGGAGIGLAVVKELTELHGGRVHARLRHGGGMAMTVVFPFVARPGTPIVTKPGMTEV